MLHRKWFIFIGLLTISLVGITGWMIQDTHAAGGTYKILAWNDLGMHCYSSDFADLAVLPPYNTLWVQVVKVADPPELVTSGITVEYYYADNTYSAGKTNFWNYDQALFGVDLPTDIGLKGKGLSGTMDLAGDHFVAEGIPITEYSDSAPTIRQPYQLATVVVKDSTTGDVLTSSQVVTPTSSEMRCDKCHSDSGIARPSVPTGKVETNILQLHDENAGTTLMASRPVLCASCHASNALGAPGKPGIKNLSKSMHEQHAGIVPGTLDGCYNCHPGPQTRCLRDVMSTEEGMTCLSCHGGLSTVANNSNPWLHEPRCDSCHNSGLYNQDQPLYRFSKGHGGLYCESCHDSTHAVAPSREANDAIKFNQLQGRNGPLQECSVCHAHDPSTGGPHSTLPPHVDSILRTNPSPTNLSVVSYKVTFNMNVTGVDKSDFYLTTTGVSGASITAVTGSNSTYTIALNTGSGNGTIRLDLLDNDSIVNGSGTHLGGTGAGNGNYNTGQVYTIQRYTFADVPPTHPYYNDIEILYANGLTGGCATSPLKFCPDQILNRAQAAVFMMRGTFGSAYAPNPTSYLFQDDWSKGQWAQPWVEAMREANMTSGCQLTPPLYCPWTLLPREQVVIFGLKLKHGNSYTPPAATGKVFADMTNPSYYATAWAENAYAEGLIVSCGTNGGKPLFCPKNMVNRGQAASIIVKARDLTMP
jgi:hypothetical protein